MNRRVKATSKFDLSRHVGKLDEEETSLLVSEALRHLETDEIIELVLLELSEAGKTKLLKRLIGASQIGDAA